MGCIKSDNVKGGGESQEVRTKVEIRSEIRKLTGMVVDAHTTESLGNLYGTFGGWEWHL